MPELAPSDLRQGMVIAYLMHPDELPTHPELEWHGKIKEICNCLCVVEVEILDEGYEGYDEVVHVEQIVRVESVEQLWVKPPEQMP
jgi:hypothetical protein